MRRWTATGFSLAVLASLASCAGAHRAATPAPDPAATPSVSAPTAPPSAVASTRRPHKSHPTPTPPAATRIAATAAAPFRWSTAHVTAASLGRSWHAGCPVSPSGLRAISLTFWGFDGTTHHGTLIGNASAVPAYVAAFRAMYSDRFPIRRMRPISAYRGSDNRSMAADNTSAFNCRYAIANGPKRWSMHAYGNAVDIDPRENPYRLNGKVLPPEGAPYMNRSNVRRGMIVARSATVRAFAATGWGWGGSWSSTPDYQHFSSTGQ